MYQLTAKLSLKDGMSSKLDKITNHMKRMDRVTEMAKSSFTAMDRAAGRSLSNITRGSASAAASLKNMAHAAGGAASSIGSLRGQFVGLATAIGSAYAAKSLFDRTIGSAAQSEMSQIQISAMFTDDGKAKEYMESLRKMAVASPLLNSNQMMANSKGFLGLTQDLGALGDTWKVVEKLMAWQPEKSVEDAVFSIRELANSKDVVSLSDRFGLNKKDLHQIKNLDFGNMMKGLDKILAKLRITDDYIAKIGGSALAQWNQIKEKMDVALTDIGLASLEHLKPVLLSINNALDGPGFKNFKDNVAKAVAGGFREILSAGQSAYSYIEKYYLNNAAFQKLDFKGKLSFVIDDLYANFERWYSSKGFAQLQSLSKTLITDLSKIIENNSVEIVSIGASIGKSLAVGAIQGFAEGTGSIINTLGDKLQDKYRQFTNWVDVAIEGKAPKKATTPGIPSAKSTRSLGSQSFSNALTVGGSFAKGTESVPRDMLAQIHKGEMIVPKVQADIIRKFGIDNIIKFPMDLVNDTVTNNNVTERVVNNNNVFKYNATERFKELVTSNNNFTERFNTTNNVERFFSEKVVPVTNTETVKYIPQSVPYTMQPAAYNVADSGKGRGDVHVTIETGAVQFHGVEFDAEKNMNEILRVMARRLEEAAQLMAR